MSDDTPTAEQPITEPEEGEGKSWQEERHEQSYPSSPPEPEEAQ